MIGTGLRVGEVTGLRWCDIDMESGMIDVNHTLVYYDHRTEESKSGCYFNVNTTKTPASMRQVPMLSFMREAFEQEKQKQEDLGLHCEVTIDGEKPIKKSDDLILCVVKTPKDSPLPKGAYERVSYSGQLYAKSNKEFVQTITDSSHKTVKTYSYDDIKKMTE